MKRKNPLGDFKSWLIRHITIDPKVITRFGVKASPQSSLTKSEPRFEFSTPVSVSLHSVACCFWPICHLSVAWVWIHACLKVVVLSVPNEGLCCLLSISWGRNEEYFAEISTECYKGLDFWLTDLDWPRKQAVTPTHCKRTTSPFRTYCGYLLCKVTFDLFAVFSRFYPQYTYKHTCIALWVRGTKNYTI